MRRRLLLLIVVVCTLVLGGCEQPPPQPFTIVMMPDTQCYADFRIKTAEKKNGPGDYTKYFFDQVDWIAREKQRLNIKAVLHMGDIVQTDYDPEWEVAAAALSRLDGVVPYCLCPGNHDMGCVERPNGGFDTAVTRDSQFPKWFPRDKFAAKPWFGGSYDDTITNAWYRIEAGGMKIMVVSLEFKPRDQVLEWANSVVAAHPDHRVIMHTHAYLDNDQRDSARLSDQRLSNYPVEGNSGDGMWEKFVSQHPNMFMVLCGHVAGEGRRIGIGRAGNEVHEILADYQDLANGGDGWLRYLTFYPTENRIEVHTYSPSLDQHDEKPSSRFTLQYQMTARSE